MCDFKTEPSYHGNWLKQRLTVNSFLDKDNKTDRWAVKGKWVQYRVRHDGLFSLPKSVSFIALLYLYCFLRWYIEHILKQAPTQMNLLFCHNPICKGMYVLWRKELKGRALHLFSQIIVSCQNHQGGRAITQEMHLHKVPFAANVYILLLKYALGTFTP